MSRIASPVLLRQMHEVSAPAAASGSEAGSYLRPIDSYKAQRPSRACCESKAEEEEKKDTRRAPYALLGPNAHGSPVFQMHFFKKILRWMQCMTSPALLRQMCIYPSRARNLLSIASFSRLSRFLVGAPRSATDASASLRSNGLAEIGVPAPCRSAP